MEGETLADQIERQRQAWRQEARERYRQQLEEAQVERIVRGTFTQEVPWVEQPVRRTPMPSQEDEITLLDDAPERAAPRAARRPNVEFTAFAADHDVVEGDGEPVEVTGIQEISMTQAAAMTKKKGRKVTIKPVIEKPRALLHRGEPVFAVGKMLYQRIGGRATQLAYVNFTYIDSNDEPQPALSIMHGHTPVFFTSKQDMAAFKALTEKLEISVVEGKSLAFFTGTEYWLGDDMMVVMVSDGEVVRYGGRNADERIMRLTNPIDQNPDQIFTAITSFATKSVAGAVNGLALEKERLRAITDRRSEDVFLYLSDMPPLPGKEDVHQFAMARLEEAYNADLSLANAVKTQLKSYAEKIEKAKSQIPNGRKGVPLRNSYLKSRVVTDLLDFFKVIRDGSNLKVIFGFKKQLLLQNIDYGRPEVTINMNCQDGVSKRGGTFILESNGVQVRSADKNAFLHPHIEGMTRWCLGTFIGPINSAIMGGNIPVAASLLWKYLSNYNPESPLVRIETCRDQMAMARPRDLIVRRK